MLSPKFTDVHTARSGRWNAGTGSLTAPFDATRTGFMVWMVVRMNGDAVNVVVM